MSVWLNVTFFFCFVFGKFPINFINYRLFLFLLVLYSHHDDCLTMYFTGKLSGSLIIDTYCLAISRTTGQTSDLLQQQKNSIDPLPIATNFFTSYFISINSIMQINHSEYRTFELSRPLKKIDMTAAIIKTYCLPSVSL